MYVHLVCGGCAVRGPRSVIGALTLYMRVQKTSTTKLQLLQQQQVVAGRFYTSLTLFSFEQRVPLQVSDNKLFEEFSAHNGTF